MRAVAPYLLRVQYLSTKIENQASTTFLQGKLLKGGIEGLYGFFDGQIEAIIARIFRDVILFSK